MDFLDPQKLRRNQLALLVGYGLITIAIAFTMLVLLYQAVGFGLDKQGKVIQNGLVFVSSQPPGSQIYLNGAPYKDQTNTKLKLPSGDYNLKITADGYRDWTQRLTVNGDDVQRFDYPFLFPKVLKSTAVSEYAAPPLFASQSPDRKWLFVKPANDAPTLTLYDLRDPKKPVSQEISLPTTVVTAGDGAQTWTAVEWASDNRHLLVRHDYGLSDALKHEYIVVDRSDPQTSVNVTKAVTLADGEVLTLFDKKADRFYAFDAVAGTLRSFALNGSLTPLSMDHIIAFKSYGSDTLLYVTNTTSTTDKTSAGVHVMLKQGDKTYSVRDLPAGASDYLLDIAQYSDEWYVIVAAGNDSAVYLYRNLQDQQLKSSTSLPTPWRRFALKNPTRVSFSSSAQFIMAQSGQEFWVYNADPEHLRSYHYKTTQPLDEFQKYAVWMDGSHLTYVSGGKQLVFDFDYQNVQSLQAAFPDYLPMFDAEYSLVYSIAPGAKATVPAALFSTPLTVQK
ncbi:PEGA domain-containing protein [Candidatus Saccharibacteria bacterium]|nr:MAG: PEGA domain-containing protein [Candidatus Saccharibacteria bacterium]